jgi:hypothetical protein
MVSKWLVIFVLLDHSDVLVRLRVFYFYFFTYDLLMPWKQETEGACPRMFLGTFKLGLLLVLLFYLKGDLLMVMGLNNGLFNWWVRLFVGGRLGESAGMLQKVYNFYGFLWLSGREW